MGLFVADDGHYQGWLAALLCCWAALDEDEHPIEKQKNSRPTTARNTVWNEQPTPLRPLPSSTHTTPGAANSNKGIEAAFNDDDLVRPISERPPSIKPLDFGGSSPLLDKMSLHSRQKSSTTLPKRISIGRPTDFRRLEYTEKQRRSLVPLQLSPVVLREHTPDPLGIDPAGNRLSRSADGLMADTTNIRNSYRASRGTPFERCQQLSESARSNEPATGVNERGQIILDTKVQTPTRPPLSTQSSSSSMRSLRRQALESSSSNATTISSRPSSERIRLKRKRSSQKGSGGSADLNVDKEILELNTIVEERRAESARPQSPTGEGHVAAVAPKMAVRARSETLTDIGSAFSRPLISVTTSMSQPEEATAPTEKTFSPVTPIKSRLSRPFVSMPDPSIVESGRLPIRRPSSRVTGWLTNLWSSSSSSTPAPSTSNNNNPSQDQFYTCAPPVRHRAVSETSLCTNITDLESPAFTATSSPMSKTHSRSLTAESRMTPISPPSTVDENAEPDGVMKWPDHPSQVGLAL